MAEERTIHLYPYQADMVNRIEKAFESFRSVMVQMPTGTGKTHVIAVIARKFVSEGKTVWMVAHRRELVTQIRNTLALYLSKEEMSLVEVRSVQWLTRHFDEEGVPTPSLIIIDEAHHALARTYSFLMKAFPDARKLGVTATPYRLSGEGFTDLFDTLLKSKSIYDFMVEGRLSLYDYRTVKEDAEDLQLIKSIRKHGADGDYDAKELDGKYNQLKTIEHLYASFKRYASNRKGFVYAMNISHAENITAYYCSMGIKAAAVSSQTPKLDRQKTIDAFKNGAIQVLVSVDLFSEGFDVPDAEFIQLARPTLSLAKHLQMVGRGLRVANGKDYCVILDSVGNYWNFGLPSDDRNWQLFFNGYDSKTVRLFTTKINKVPPFVSQRFVGTPIINDEPEDGKLDLVADHREQKDDIAILNAYPIVTEKNGLKGVADRYGNIILPCEYRNLETSRDGIVTVRGKKTFFLDLYNGKKYQSWPNTFRINGFPVAFYNEKLYFRLRSRFIGEDSSVDIAQVLPFPFYNILRWDKILFFHREDGWKTYRIIKRSEHGAVICEGECGGLYMQPSPDEKPLPVKDLSEAEKLLEKYEQDYRQWTIEARSLFLGYVDADNVEKIFEKCKVKKCGDGIYEVTKINGEKYWFDGSCYAKFSVRPMRARCGVVDLLYVDDVYFITVSNHFYPSPLRLWEIRSNDSGCIAHGLLFTRDNEVGIKKIVEISPDGRSMDVKTSTSTDHYEMYKGRFVIIDA